MTLLLCGADVTLWDVIGITFSLSDVALCGVISAVVDMSVILLSFTDVTAWVGFVVSTLDLSDVVLSLAVEDVIV